ncbi:ankyrin repeat domain-containing protein 66-like isoform X1 [Pocillopora damicornis]|nr:ankyrin repeat domain-containing protein 66-like isoform X1 [Pocillopora damicornis]
MTNQEKPPTKQVFNSSSHDLLLHETCALGDDTKLEELGSFIRGGKIDVNSRDEEWGNRAALHWAAHRGHAKCVKLLLEYGADPAARMVGGWTPAHCAAETGRSNVLKILIEHQAPVMIADNSGDTPKRVAEIYGHTACIELLESAEESSVQKQLLIRDKFRSNTRKVSRIVAEKGLEGLQGKVTDVAS